MMMLKVHLLKTECCYWLDLPLLPSEFWREAAPRILKACLVLLRSPKLQLLGTLLGLSSKLGSMLGDRRRAWMLPNPPGPPGTPGPTPEATPGPTVGTTRDRMDKNGTHCNQKQFSCLELVCLSYQSNSLQVFCQTRSSSSSFQQYRLLG